MATNLSSSCPANQPKTIQPTSHPTNQPPNQPAKQPTSHPTNQPNIQGKADKPNSWFTKALLGCFAGIIYEALSDLLAISAADLQGKASAQSANAAIQQG